MKRIGIFTPIIVFLFIVACNSSNDKDLETTKKTGTSKTPADSLMEDVMDGHNIAMGKMGKLSTMQIRMQQIIDSIEKLPAKAKKMLAPYKDDAKKAMENLKEAKGAMEKWMDDFDMDSAINNIDNRLKYLRDEKWKVSQVKENILKSLNKADSLIKQKFN